MADDDFLSSFLREVENGMTVPHAGVPEGMDTMWILPTAPTGQLPHPPSLPTNQVPLAAPPVLESACRPPTTSSEKPRMKRRADPKRVKKSHSKKPTTTAPQSLPKVTPTHGVCYLGDPKDYVNDVFEKVIAPCITGATPVLTSIRQHIYRRAVCEFASLALREMVTRGPVTIDDIVAVTMKACERAGLNLSV